MSVDPLFGRTVDDLDHELFQSQLALYGQAQSEVHMLSTWKKRVIRLLQKVFDIGLDAYLDQLFILNEALSNDDCRRRWTEAAQRANEDGHRESRTLVQQNLSWLPHSISNIYVIDIVTRVASTQHLERTKIHFLSDHVVGPAVPIAFWANIWLWTFYLVFPWIAYLPARFGWFWYCPQGNFANYSQWLLCPYVPVLLNAMRHEFQALVYALPPQVAIMGPFISNAVSSHGWRGWGGRHSFGIFITCASIMSVFSHMDLATNGLFLSKVLATGTCHAHSGSPSNMESIEDFWQRVWSRSLWSLLFGLEPPELLHLVVGLWALMFSQFFYGIVSSVPRTTRDPQDVGPLCGDPSGLRVLLTDSAFYAVRDRDLGGRFVTYPTLLHRRTQHGAALLALAESARMYTVCYSGWSHKQHLVNMGLYKSGQVFNDIVRTLLYFVVFMWFESLIQIELQGTALEVGKSLSNDRTVDVQMLVSVLLSVIVALYNLYVACDKMWSQSRACLQAETRDERQISENYNVRAKTYCKLSIVFFVVLVSGFTCFLAHAIVKVAMVVLVCDCGWNLGVGCVEFGGACT